MEEAEQSEYILEPQLVASSEPTAVLNNRNWRWKSSLRRGSARADEVADVESVELISGWDSDCMLKGLRIEGSADIFWMLSFGALLWPSIWLS